MLAKNDGTELGAVHSTARSGQCQYRRKSWRCQYDHRSVVPVRPTGVEKLLRSIASTNEDHVGAPYRFAMPVLTENRRQCQYVQERNVEEIQEMPVLITAVPSSQLLVLRFQLRHCFFGSASFAALQTSLLWRIVPDPLLRSILPDSLRSGSVAAMDQCCFAGKSTHPVLKPSEQ